MDMLRIGYTLLISLYIVEVPCIGDALPMEYCQFQYFNATCKKDEVVVMTLANYGRMRTGRCMPNDHGTSGCQHDVINLLDVQCSGKQNCSFEVPGIGLKHINPCERGLTSYLEADYRCVRVAQSKKRSCFNANKIVVPAQTSGFLGSVVTRERGLGTSTCPWLLRASPGQQLNVTVWDFHGPASAQENSAHSVNRQNDVIPYKCDRYATLTDPATNRRSLVCPGRIRHRKMLISQGHEVEVAVETTPYGEPNPPTFLLQYQVLGCASLSAPAHGWLEQADNKAVLGCNHTSQRWHLVCDRHTWVGEFKNCTPLETVQSENAWFTWEDRHWSTPLGIVVVSVIGLLLGLILGVLFLAVAVFCLRRRKCERFYAAHDAYAAADKQHYHDDHRLYSFAASHNTTPSRGLLEHIELSSTTPRSPATAASCDHARQYGTMAVLSYKSSKQLCSAYDQSCASDADVVTSIRNCASTQPLDDVSSTNKCNETKELLSLPVTQSDPMGGRAGFMT